MFQSQHPLMTTSRCAAARRGRGALLVLALLSWLIAIGSPTVAFYEFEEDEPAPVVGERQFVITEQQFNQMVFGGHQTVQRMVVVPRANGAQVVEVVQNRVAQTSVAEFRKRMESSAVDEIAAISSRVALTDAQKKKLQLAARGDIEQYVSRAETFRSKLTGKPMDQLQYTQLMRELQPLRMSQQLGVLVDNSLFRKTLRHTLTDEQRVRWQALERERQKSVVETAIQTWERMSNGLKITEPSRQKFIDVLVEYGELPETRTTYIYYVVLVEVGKLEDRVKPILSEEVWDKLQIQIAQAKQVEANLRRSGQWPERATDDDVVVETQRK